MKKTIVILKENIAYIDHSAINCFKNFFFILNLSIIIRYPYPTLIVD
jgi:hypothetical protein